MSSFFFLLALSWRKQKDEVTWLNLNSVRWCHEVPSNVLLRIQNESSINYLSDILMEYRIFFKSWNFYFESMLIIKVYKPYLFSHCKKFIWSPVYDFGILLKDNSILFKTGFSIFQHLSIFLRWGVATILHYLDCCPHLYSHIHILAVVFSSLLQVIFVGISNWTLCWDT